MSNVFSLVLLIIVSFFLLIEHEHFYIQYLPHAPQNKNNKNGLTILSTIIITNVHNRLRCYNYLLFYGTLKLGPFSIIATCIETLNFSKSFNTFGK